MSQNTDTIYNALVVSDSTSDTTTTMTTASLNFGSNLLSTPTNTIYSNSGILTPAGNIGFGEIILIRDATQAISIPIPNDSTTLKVVDTVEVASQVNPIGATKTEYSYDSITASNGLTINGATTFTSVPKSNVLPSLPTDLVNLTYLQNNPPPSAVIFYFNNSQVPTPTISTYALLAVLENELPQSTIPTTISGIGTIQLIQSFANQLINLNGASFIPAGVWDCNFWASCATAGDAGHIAVYFNVFGISALGIETQIGVDSSSATITSVSISQYKISLALSYTDISAYESLAVKLYAINTRSASTTITNYFESGSSYSHIHTSFGVYVPPNLLSLNNTWTGLNTFTQPIVGNLSGNASSASTIALASDNTAGSYFVPFSKTATTNNALFIDDTIGPLAYNPSTSNLTATTFTGALAGNATTSTTASVATTVSLTSDNTAGSYFIPFSKLSAGNDALFIDDTTGPLTYNPNTSNLSATTFTGDLSGNASSATTATNIQTTAIATNAGYALTMVLSTSSGSQAVNITNTLLYNPSTQNLSILSGSMTATTFNGNATTSTTASTANSGFQQNATDASSYQLFFGDNLGGSSTFYGNAGLAYTPSLNTLVATTFSGNATSASNVALTSDNTVGNYFIPFSKTASATNALYIDNAITALTYNPNTSNLTATTFTGALVGNASSSTALFTGTSAINQTYLIPYTTANGANGNYNTNTFFGINPSTGTLSVGGPVVGGIVIGSTQGSIALPGVNSSITINGNGNALSANNATLVSFTNALVNTQSTSADIFTTNVQTLASGSTINFSLGSIVVDAGAVASLYTLPVLAGLVNGQTWTMQKTSATNHNCDLTAGAGTQIASLTNVLAATFRLTNGIYTQSFRFISPNWYPY